MFYFRSDKGLAFIAAVDAGMVAKTKDGFDDDPFNIFWEKFISMRSKHYPDQDRCYDRDGGNNK